MHESILALARKFGRLLGSAALGLTFLSAGHAEESGSPLAALPSQPASHIVLIEALPGGAWLNLGAPEADPKWGRARGRAWTANMAFAPTLGGAFLFGEGEHGWFDAETGRYMDDLWFYDAMRHRWIAAYPGTDVRDPPKLHVTPDGFAANEAGEINPIATLIHGYQMTTWDVDRKTFMSVPAWHDYFDDALPSVAQFYETNGSRLDFGRASPWIFDPARAKWRRHRTFDAPETDLGAVFVYLPSIKKAFYWRKHDAWLYDPAANTWEQIDPSGPPPPFGSDATACYDPKRDRLYMGGGVYPETKGPNALWIYDVKANRWIDPAPKGSPGSVFFNTNAAVMNCDLAADAVLIFRRREEPKGVFAYHPDENAWHDAGPLLSRWDDDRYSVSGSSGFYHPGLNAHFFHVAGDSKDNGVILVYRYKAAAKPR